MGDGIADRLAERLEAALGHGFSDRGLLVQALTHRSGGADNYERLEFLGDAVLGYLVAKRLFEMHPGASEQELTLMRVSLIRKETLSEVALEIGMGAHLRLGSGERGRGLHNQPSLLADALEAVLGAVTVDGGVEAAAVVVNRLFRDRLRGSGRGAGKDAKSLLQELAQGRRMALPRYDVIRVEGADHAPRFVVRCSVDELDLESTGTGGSRKEAEMRAALELLEQFKQAV
ncbi:MAG: ribonuclease III [Gammaproteobacteria bacterium]|nr:ribonuclease III [Gammaproteobacteria bacterium]